MTTKKVFSATDAHPTVLHAKQDADSEIAFPLLCDVDGKLLVNLTGGTGGTTTITGSVSVINAVTVDTELSAALVLSDGLANPTTSSIASLLFGYIQSTGDWDRCRMAGDNADTLGTASTGHLQILSHNMIYNGAGSWDRVRGDITNGIDVDITRVPTPTSSTATLSNVSASTASTTLITANTLRLSAIIYNDSTSILYLKYGTSASTTSFTAKLLSEDYFEIDIPVYTGIVTGAWASATGDAKITHLT